MYFPAEEEIPDVANVVCLDSNVCIARTKFDAMVKHKCHKVTFTFNRKFWKRSRAYKHVYVALRRLLDDADVEEGLFFMETHSNGFPHVHGIIRWKPFNESSVFLRNKLVERFGQTKIFEYKPDDYLESKINKINTKVNSVAKELNNFVKRGNNSVKKETGNIDIEELKYKDWLEYINKDFSIMEKYRKEVKEKFDITFYYSRIEEQESESEEEDIFCILKRNANIKD